MIFKVKPFYPIVLIFVFSFCENTSNQRIEEDISDNQSVKSIRESRINDLYDGEVKELLDSLKDEVVYVDPKSGVLPGQSILMEFVVPFSDNSMELIPEGIEINGTIAIEWGLLINENKDSIEDTKSSYMFFYERLEDDQWIITKEIYNKI